MLKSADINIYKVISKAYYLLSEFYSNSPCPFVSINVFSFVPLPLTNAYIHAHNKFLNYSVHTKLDSAIFFAILHICRFFRTHFNSNLSCNT